MIRNLKEIPIGIDINNVMTAVEFTKEEYRHSKSVGMNPVFEGEKFYYYNGKMNFANMNWSEETVFGVINNSIYKVALMTSVNNKENLEESFKKNVQFISEQTRELGEFSNKGSKASWYFSDGNILLTKKEMFSYYILSLNVTSSIIKGSTYSEKSKAFMSFLKSKWVFNLLKKLKD